MTIAPLIGVLDSGVGGLSVAKPLLERFPEISMIYVADIAHVPYSNKTPEQLRSFVGQILSFFLSQNVDAVVFACNTSSALVLPGIQDTFPVPTFGVVVPGVSGALAATRGKGIGMVANTVTAKSGVFKKLIHEKNPNIPVIEVACPLLVGLVENGDLDSLEAEKTVKEYCDELDGKCDTVIYGCTHFPFLAKQFEKSLPNVRFIDPAILLTEQVGDALKGIAPKAKVVPARRIIATKEAPHVATWAKKVLNWDETLEILALDGVPSWNAGATPLSRGKAV